MAGPLAVAIRSRSLRVRAAAWGLAALGLFASAPLTAPTPARA